LTFSGRTLELQHLVTHLPPHLPLLVITAHSDPSTLPLFASRPPSSCILLPAPIPISETSAFGLAAPTISTTVALALGDAIAMATARRLHPFPADVFKLHHPGGAIGAALKPKEGPPTMGDIATLVADVPVVTKHSTTLTGSKHLSPTALDVLLAAARSSSGWVRTTPTSILAPLRIQQLGLHGPDALDVPVHALGAVEKGDWISVPATSSVEEAKGWVRGMREGGDGRGKLFLRKGTVLGIVDGKGEVSGVVEIEELGLELDD
jgi:hypothetical protein